MTGNEFIKLGIGKSDISEALKQQEQINHFTISATQEDISLKYLENWAEKEFITNDYFLNFVKTIFKTDNFLSFYKFLRYPLSSSVLIREQIVPELERVFHADDSYTHYNIQGEKRKAVDVYDSDEFNEKLFQNLMFAHNSVIVTKLDENNELKRDFVSIKNIISIDSDYNKIKRIAYLGTMPNEFGEPVEGVIYVDAEKFEFYEKTDKSIIAETPLFVWMHGLESCPVDYVCPKPYYINKRFAVRYSVFSGVRSDMEEYVFLKTIQRMTEPNGSIPITTRMKVNDVKASGQDSSKEQSSDNLPLSAQILGGQKPDFQKETLGGGNGLQAGTVYEIPAMKLDSGALDMDAIQNFIRFFYIPVEAMEYLNKRIKEIENAIVRKVVGDYFEANQAAMNETQISKSFISRQDKLRQVAKWMSKVSTSVETRCVQYLYGLDNSASIFFGSDFFIESKSEIYEMIEKAPNPIERRTLLERLAGVNNRGNHANALKDRILAMLLPYATDKDFDKAIERQSVPNEVFELQTRFSYWVSLFEANYGSIVSFWEGMEDVKDSIKLIEINNLILQLINSNTIINESSQATAV